MKDSKAEIINTERLCLRAITDEDADDVIELLISDEISKTYMLPDFASREDAYKMFELLKRLAGLRERFVYGIYLENNIIGFINDVKISDGEIELGLVIHPDHHNKGFATEVLTASIQELFRLGYSVVKTGAFEENAASIRVMEKCSMTRLKQEEYIEYRGAVHRCICFEKRNVSAV